MPGSFRRTTPTQVTPYSPSHIAYTVGFQLPQNSTTRMLVEGVECVVLRCVILKRESITNVRKTSYEFGRIDQYVERALFLCNEDVYILL
jgi:hypothetical protein